MALTLGMILEARERLKGVAQRTGLVHFKALSDEDSQIYLKTEDLQSTGSFKLRGAYIKIASLTPEERACGVIASSAGNHAQGVALAARAFDTPATIVMPEGAPLSKVKATRELGANVVLHGNVYDDAYAEACRLQAETGATFIHPFDDPMVIAGQGTIGLEIMDDMPDVRTIVVPIGGGGLASGVSAAVKMLHPDVRVVGVQASGAAGMKASIEAGHVVELDSAKTIADGIAVKKPGELTFELCSRYVDEIVTVDDDEIAQAILLLMERGKMVAEGAGATAVAAIMSRKFDVSGKVVAVISGGNIDVTMISRIIEKGLLRAGRVSKLRILMQDRPGQLEQVSRLIAGAGANVMAVHHDRTDVDLDIRDAILEITMETQDREHAQRVIKALREAGFKVN
ncbi:MAG TPA: threonine ammonia-lyase [Candidatus Ventricola gallistercoris]|nr:threonine ammonia-lyase [Candidatus Ventricola gallistercoris]